MRSASLPICPPRPGKPGVMMGTPAAWLAVPLYRDDRHTTVDVVVAAVRRTPCHGTWENQDS